MSARKPIDAPKKSMTEKILLVEDDPMIGEAVVNALADAGKAADWARSGWEATGFLSENKYDAVLLDLGLPGKDGMSVLRELRAKDSETPVVILTARDGLDKLEAMLSALGIDGIEIEDEADFQSFLAGNRKYWDYVDEDLLAQKKGKCRIKCYLEDNEEAAAQLARVRLGMEDVKAAHSGEALGPMTLTVKEVQDADWENNWKQYYQPIAIGERLLVVPEWLETEAADRVPLVLDPGLAFGTGSHATTRMCLKQLDKRVHGGERVLDLGCGSGILSIAALCLGAQEAFACDIDEKAADVAYENAARNGIGTERYTVLAGDILTDAKLQAAIGEGYDLVMANIVADVILALAPAVKGLLAPGGVFLCSGIIDTRAKEVADKLRTAGLELLETDCEEGWFAYAARIKQ